MWPGIANPFDDVIRLHPSRCLADLTNRERNTTKFLRKGTTSAYFSNRLTLQQPRRRTISAPAVARPFYILAPAKKNRGNHAGYILYRGLSCWLATGTSMQPSGPAN
jgi:hypothetical protein